MDPDLPSICEANNNTEVARRFACSNAGGMRRSHKTNTLVLVSDRRPITNFTNSGFAVGLHIPPAKEMPGVATSVLDQIDKMTDAMRAAIAQPDPRF